MRTASLASREILTTIEVHEIQDYVEESRGALKAQDWLLITHLFINLCIFLSTWLSL